MSPTGRVLSLLALALATPAAYADARDDLAAAFGIPRDAVVDARRVTLGPAGARWPFAVVGRYHADGHTTPGVGFPGLAVAGPCDKGTCWHRVYLGAIAREVTLGPLVDLDADLRPLPQGALRGGPDHVGATAARAGDGAALLVVLEDALDQGTERRLELVALSPTPHVVASVTLESRSPEPDHEPERPPMTVGTRVEAIRVGRHDGARRLMVTERPIDSRWNGCLRSPPVEVPWSWHDGRFVRDADAPTPKPCR